MNDNVFDDKTIPMIVIPCINKDCQSHKDKEPTRMKYQLINE
jgi:hypothetical protein